MKFSMSRRIITTQKHELFKKLGRDTYQLSKPRNVFDWSEKKFRSRLRFSKENFGKILQRIRPSLRRVRKGRHSHPPEVSNLN